MTEVLLMCGGVNYGEVEQLVSVKRWFCSKCFKCGGISRDTKDCCRSSSRIDKCDFYTKWLSQPAAHSPTWPLSPLPPCSPAVAAFGQLCAQDGNPLQQSFASAHFGCSTCHLHTTNKDAQHVTNNTA